MLFRSVENWTFAYYNVVTWKSDLPLFHLFCCFVVKLYILFYTYGKPQIREGDKTVEMFGLVHSWLRLKYAGADTGTVEGKRDRLKPTCLEVGEREGRSWNCEGRSSVSGTSAGSSCP